MRSRKNRRPPLQLWMEQKRRPVCPKIFPVRKKTPFPGTAVPRMKRKRPERSSVRIFPSSRGVSGPWPTTASCFTATITITTFCWPKRPAVCGWAYPASMIPGKPEPRICSVFPSLHGNMPRSWIWNRKSAATAMISATGAAV